MIYSFENPLLMNNQAVDLSKNFSHLDDGDRLLLASSPQFQPRSSVLQNLIWNGMHLEWLLRYGFLKKEKSEM